MAAVCIDCWYEMHSHQTICPNCGAKIDSDSPSYERLLLWALKNSRPVHRALICKVLGLRGTRSAAPHLIEMINDYAVTVRVAALRALGLIGDESAIPAIERALSSESLPVRIAARDALKEMGVDRRESSPVRD
jgi:HEAT repeat protein